MQRIDCSLHGGCSTGMIVPNLGAYAADNRWPEIDELLVSPAVHALNRIDKSTLLCELLYYGRESIVQPLLAGGADVNFRFEWHAGSRFAYKVAAYPGSTPLGQTILGASYRRFNTLPAIEALLLARADPNALTYQGYTPLQLAIVQNCPEHALALLTAGADPHLKCEYPVDAFELAQDSPWAREMLSRWRTSVS
jgi:ankyrin repeat protein